MVTASKLASSSRAGDSTQLPSTDCEGLQSRDLNDSFEFDESLTVESANYLLSDLPLGEQLVLETYLRCRQRSYDRERIDELARPRKLIGPEKCVPSVKVDKVQMEAIVSRLTRQRTRKETDADKNDAMHSLARHGRTKLMSDFDLQGLIQRLATVKPPRSMAKLLSEQEARTVPRATRPLDSARISALATPRRRGATCASWGVPDDWTLPSIPTAGPDSSFNGDRADGSKAEPQQKHASEVELSLPDLCTGGGKDSHSS